MNRQVICNFIKAHIKHIAHLFWTPSCCFIEIISLPFQCQTSVAFVHDFYLLFFSPPLAFVESWTFLIPVLFHISVAKVFLWLEARLGNLLFLLFKRTVMFRSVLSTKLHDDCDNWELDSTHTTVEMGSQRPQLIISFGSFSFLFFLLNP